MIYSVLVFLTIFIILDSKLLKKENNEDFMTHFAVSKKTLFLLILIFLAILVLSDKNWEILPILLITFLLPLYLFKRYKYLNSLEGRDNDFYLASDAFGVVFYWFLGGVVISTLVQAFMIFVLEFDSELSVLMLTAVGSSFLLILLIYRASGRISGRGFWANVNLKKGDNSFFKIAVLPAVVGLICASISIAIIFLRDIAPDTPLSEALKETQSSGMLMTFLILAVCFAPLVEEIVFRGYLFNVLNRLKGSKFTIVVITLSFGFLHVGQYWGDWMAILMVGLLGFLLTLFRAWTNSTVASVVMHYFYNAGVTLIPVIMIMMTHPAFYKYQAQYPYLSAKEKEILLKTSIQNDPEFIEAYNELAWLYAEEKINLIQALELINTALRSEPEYDIYLDTKANILEKLGRFDEALIIRKKLLKQTGR